MFKYIITAVAALIATPAFGQDDFCGNLGGLAQEFLSQRYDGVPMSTQMAILNESVEPGALRDLVRDVMVNAYQEPLNRRTRAEHVAAFRNRWEVACYEAEADYI